MLKQISALLIIIIFSPLISFADAGRIFKGNDKAVVTVKTYNKKGQQLTEGSGFIVRTDGVIVTNFHVISIASDVKVKAGDKTLDVEGLIYEDKENDIVILKVKGENFHAVTFGDTEKLTADEKVYVISSSDSRGNIISEGTFNGIKKITSDRKALKITAPITHGSSGSPVFNKNGEVIGIVVFLTREEQNLILAMPVNLIKDKINSSKVMALKDSIKKDYKTTAEYWFYLGYYLTVVDAYKEAAEAFKEAIKIKPDYADAYYNLGSCYEKTGRIKEAVKSYKQAIKIKPDFVDAFFSAGVAYGKLGMYKNSAEFFEQALKLEPDSADAYYNLGIAYGKLKMYKQAKEAFKHAAIFKPGNADAHYNLGLIDLILKDRESALEEYRALKTLNSQKAEKLYHIIYK